MAYRFENNEIVIDGWEVGISNSPYQTITQTNLVAQGVSDMRNIDIISVPGEASVAMATQAMITQTSMTNVTISAIDPVLYTWLYTGAALEVGTAVTLSTTGSLPTNYSINTAYYVIDVTPIGGGAYHIHLSTNAGGAVLSYSTLGTGTQSFSTIDMGTPLFFADYLWNKQYYFYFLQDSNGRIWVYNQSSPSWFNGTGKWTYMNSGVSGENPIFLNTANGLCVYKGYLFFFTSNYINAISIVDQSTDTINLAHLTSRNSWFFSWQLLAAATYSDISHQAIVSQLNQMLICNGSGLAIVFEVPGSLDSASGNSFSLAETHTIATGATTNASTTITTGSSFFQPTDVGAVIVGTNIPAGAFIASVTSSTQANLSFLTPATGTGTGITFTITKSYNYNSQVLILPETDQATCLTELGGECLIGGINNFIYPWDEVSISYGAIIRISENHTYQMVTINTTTYIFAGSRGRIFVTNGANVQLLAKMQDHLSGTVNPYYTWKGATFDRNQLYFGVQGFSNTGSAINQYGGLWAIDSDTNAMRLLNQLSYGTYAGYASAIIANRGAFVSSTPANIGYGLFVGWNNGTTGGVDQSVSTPYTSGQAYVDSDIIPVGTFITKKTFSNLEYKLATPLVAGETVTVSYRTNITENYTDVPITEGGQVGELSGYAPVNFQNVQWIQLRAFLTSTATNPSYTRLKELRIR